MSTQEARYKSGIADETSFLPTQQDLLELKRRKAALNAGQPLSTAAAQPPTTSAEAEEIARIQEMIKNSPDLINAPDAVGRRPLHAAAEAGQVIVAEYLLKNAADANLKDNNGDTPLSLAASGGHRVLAELLLKHGASVDAADSSGETPLHKAAAKGFKSVVELLLANKAKVDARDNFGDTPLHKAAAAGQAAVAELLLAHHAEVNAKNSGPPPVFNLPNQHTKGATPLVEAILGKQVAVVKLLLADKAEVNIECEIWHFNRGGQLSLRSPSIRCSPLFLAAAVGNPEIVKLLLDSGAAPNAQTSAADESAGGLTPLLAAARLGEAEIAQLLLSHKADPNTPDSGSKDSLGTTRPGRFGGGGRGDPNTPDSGGKTPLHYAVIKKSRDLIKLLLANHAEVNRQDRAGWTPLCYAMNAADIEIAAALLDAKADPNVKDQQGRSLLLLAVADWDQPGHQWSPQTRREMVKLLLAHGGEVDARDHEGKTPLNYAVENRNTEIAAILLDANASPNVKDPVFQTLLHRVLSSTQPGGTLQEMVKLLVAHHADVNCRDEHGKTPLSYAAGLAETDIAAVLLDAKADPNVKDENGQTPLHVAAQWGAHGNKAMVELLLAKGAEPNIRDNAGNTPLALAKQPRQPGFPVPMNINLLPQPGFSPGLPGQPARFPAPTSVQTPAQPGEIAELLRKHGAIEDLPRTDVIEVRRPSANYSQVVFTKGTNNYNRFSLYELIAAHYGFVTQDPSVQQGFDDPGWRRQGALAFPILDRVTVQHPTGNALGWTGYLVNGPFRRPDCSGDQQLQWGDVVEIPEADHPINAIWQGLPEEILAGLRRCVDRHVLLTVKGQTTNLLLSLQTKNPAGGVQGALVPTLLRPLPCCRCCKPPACCAPPRTSPASRSSAATRPPASCTSWPSIARATGPRPRFLAPRRQRHRGAGEVNAAARVA